MEPSPHPGRRGAPGVMIVIGALFIVSGGLVAAVTGPLKLVHGSWLAAYLVLVFGVAQLTIGAVQSSHQEGPAAAPPVRGWTQLVCLNVGNTGVIVGTLTRSPLVVDGAAVLLVVAFGIALHGARPSAMRTVGIPAVFAADGQASRLLMWFYRVFLTLLLVSLPVGSVLAHLRMA